MRVGRAAGWVAVLVSAVGPIAGGRYRLFESSATNVVQGDTNHAADLFLRDRRTGRTIRVDRTTSGGQASRGVGGFAEDIGVAMTPGARWVAFVSPSTNLASPANRWAHVYRRGPLD